MKKIICSILMFTMLLSFSACDPDMSEIKDIGVEPADTLVQSYKKEHAPSQVVKTKSYWVQLVSEYFGTNYRISVSKEPDDITTVYTADNVLIYYFEANDDYVVWCEETVDTYDYKLYSIKEDTVQTLFSADIEEGYLPQNVGIYQNKVYYPVVDYQKETADIYCYDTQTGKNASVSSLPYDGEYSIMTMNVEANYLTVASTSDIVVFDVEKECLVQQTPLPREVGFVFAVSYDYINEKCALYYSDEDSEDIGFINEAGEMDSHFTFGDNQYAFEDKITCIDGHIYWIVQMDSTGDVSDHYRYVEYDYVNHKPYEIKRVFNLEVNEDHKYYLAFGSDGAYQEIALYKR